MSASHKPTVFISYSHSDKKWKERIVKQLSVLRPQGLLDIWEDQQIAAGAIWHKEIQEALEVCSIAILVISANSLTSEYILANEVPALIKLSEEKGVHIIPLIVEPCAWKTVEWLSRMNLRPTDGRPLSAGNKHQINVELAALTEEIEAIIKAQTLTKSVPLNPEDISVGRLRGKSPELFGRNLELVELEAAWADPNINIISLIAWGGVGKSELVHHWRLRMAPRYGGAQKVYAWSFYRQGTSGQGVSADEFIADALRWFGDANSSEGSQWGKGERLATLIRRQRTLLLLDGLEPLQEPPRSGVQAGSLKEESMRALLGELAVSNPGLCVITSRLPVSDLTDCERYTVRRIDLEHLSPKAGAELLRKQGVEGEQDELEQASIEFGGHALALILLGSYLRIVHDGQITQRDKVDLLKQDEEDSGHAKRVMASYEQWFSGEPELAVLRMIALFDRPAEGPAIAALRQKSDIPNLTESLKDLSEEDWKRILARLRDARLIAEEDPDEPDTLDAHPLVREYFKKQLKQNYLEAWRKGNNQLFEYFSGAVKYRPDVKEEMYFLYRAVAHGCQANRHKWTFVKVYYDRIQRRQEFFAPSKLGTVGADIAALSCFFDVPWEQPVASITGRWRDLLFGQVGYRLWMAGRLKEAVAPIKKALAADVARAKKVSKTKVAIEAWKYASIDAVALASIYLSLGNLSPDLPEKEQALYYSALGSRYAFESDDRAQIVSAFNTLGEVLHYKNYLSQSLTIFQYAEEIKAEGEQTATFPRSMGQRLHDLLLSLGKYGEVQKRAERLLESEGPEGLDLIDSALLHLSLGQAHLFQAKHNKTKHFALAKKNLNLAMEELRRAGRVVHIPRGRLALAKLHLFAGEFKEAKTNLDEAMGTVMRGKMGLHEADCHLEYARLYLVRGERKKARESWAQAREMIERMGYHRRDKDVREIEEALKEEKIG